MTDSKELKRAIKESGISVTHIATVLGISRGALYMKIDNVTEFKASEIVVLKKMLNLSDKQRDDIFFNIKVE
nr:MAG TPA: Regulatory protein [Caudoviricetes sp.]